MKKIISLSLLCVIILISSMVLATTTFNVALEPNKNIVKANEELEVILKLENFTPGEKGVDVLIATLEYDRSIFEVVEAEDIVPIENWDVPTYNIANGTFVTMASKFVDVSHNALKITFKVKPEIGEANSTKILLKNISASDGEADIEVDNAELELSVGEPIINNENKSNYIAVMSIFVIVIIGIVIVIAKRKNIKK